MSSSAAQHRVTCNLCRPGTRSGNATLHTNALDYGWVAALNQLVPARGFFDSEKDMRSVAQSE
eukprot:m.925056 g.925056  ORF g.925056 m.925056 type:complete len:63 (+) comp126844_c0_seq1:154-342(+)